MADSETCPNCHQGVLEPVQQARVAYYAQDSGSPKYSGIRYMSRVLPNEECWAVFEGTPIVEVSRRSIDVGDPDLKTVADTWGLRIF